MAGRAVLRLGLSGGLYDVLCHVGEFAGQRVGSAGVGGALDGEGEFAFGLGEGEGARGAVVAERPVGAEWKGWG